MQRMPVTIRYRWRVVHGAEFMNEFENVVTTEQELRDIVGIPIPRVVQKDRPFIDAHCRAFIER